VRGNRFVMLRDFSSNDNKLRATVGYRRARLSTSCRL
jgi:hypothetical protein